MASSSSDALNTTPEQRGAALAGRAVSVPCNGWGGDHATSTEYITGTVGKKPKYRQGTDDFVYTIFFRPRDLTAPIYLSCAQLMGRKPYGDSSAEWTPRLLPKKDTRKGRGAHQKRDEEKQPRGRHLKDPRIGRTAQDKKARQRVASRQAYERRCQHVRQRHTNAQPINCGGGDGRDCPSHMRCDHPLCPQRFDASFSEDAEKCELRFHASTNVVFSMPHADEKLLQLIDTNIAVSDERKAELTEEWNASMGAGVPLCSCASCGRRGAGLDYYRVALADLPSCFKMEQSCDSFSCKAHGAGMRALTRDVWQQLGALEHAVELVKIDDEQPRDGEQIRYKPAGRVNLRKLVSCYAEAETQVRPLE